MTVTEATPVITDNTPPHSPDARAAAVHLCRMQMGERRAVSKPSAKLLGEGSRSRSEIFGLAYSPVIVMVPFFFQ